MPLIKSKSPEAFKSNIKAEMKAGKPMSQSLAIAYSMKKKAKKMAMGGEMKSGYQEHEGNTQRPDEAAIMEAAKLLNQHMVHAEDSGLNSEVDKEMEEDSKDFSQLDRYADGGEVTDERAAAAKRMREAFASTSGSPAPTPSPAAPIASGYADGGLVDKIMAKRKMMSQGGKVANDGSEDLADFSPNNFDDLVLRDDLESSYTGANSGDSLGDAQEDKDRADIVARILKQRSMKQHNPRPA